HRRGAFVRAYPNSCYFGEQAYGVQAAAERYFGLPARSLDPAQATMLAGLIQAPSVFDPLRNPELRRGRQTEVMRWLVRSGYFAEAHAAAVLAQPLRLR